MNNAITEIPAGIPFVKMTGSGNDFVVLDDRAVNGELLTRPEVIRAICNRHNGIGADGVVLLEARPPGADARIHYFNSDGSAASLCGNATLCATAMTAELLLGHQDGLTLYTDAGLIRGRMIDGLPEIDLQAVTEVVPDAPVELQAGEDRVGFAIVGVPHLVLLCNNEEQLEQVDVMKRGGALRRHAWLGDPGANVNFVARRADGSFRYRTFERGVEGETLACGTGSIAAALLLVAWGVAVQPVTLWTSSGRTAVVTLQQEGWTPGVFRPSLRGEGRVVFKGHTESVLAGA